PSPAHPEAGGVDPCAKIRNDVRALNQKVADLRGQMEGATGSVLHGLAGQLNAALKQLSQAEKTLAACEAKNKATNDGCHGNTSGVDPNSKAILANVRVMVLLWGKFYQDHPGAANNAFVLCRDLVTGTYFNHLSQYGVVRGSM